MAEDKNSPFVRIDTREIEIQDELSEDSNVNIPVVHETGEWGAGLGLGSEVSSAKEIRGKLGKILREIESVYGKPTPSEYQIQLIRNLTDYIDENFPTVEERETLTLVLLYSDVLALGEKE